MRTRNVARRGVAAVSLTALALTGTGLSHALAGTTPGVDREVLAHQRVVLDATWRVSGWTVDPDGWEIDGIQVVATHALTGEVAASALSYGGEYELWVPAGAYSVTYSREGYVTRTRTLVVAGNRSLDDVTMLRVAPQPVTLPEIQGTARVGSVLVADPGTWDVEDATLTWQWLVDGRPVAGATGERFRVLPDYFREEIGLRVRATRPGHAEGVEEVAATVAAGRFDLVFGTPRRSGREWRVPVTVDAPTWAAPDGRARFRGDRGSDDVRIRDGAGTAELPYLRGLQHYTVRFEGPRSHLVPNSSVTVRGR